MENQVLLNRYIDKKDLLALLQRLFKKNYFFEVSSLRHYNCLFRLTWDHKQTKGDTYALQVERRLTKVFIRLELPNASVV